MLKGEKFIDELNPKLLCKLLYFQCNPISSSMISQISIGYSLDPMLCSVIRKENVNMLNMFDFQDFWDFGWHEGGLYDVTASMNKTFWSFCT